MVGLEVVELPSDERGDVDMAALRPPATTPWSG
jgi:glycine cleavage system protein P-like pyridoxal-binding family